VNVKHEWNSYTLPCLGGVLRHYTSVEPGSAKDTLAYSAIEQIGPEEFFEATVVKKTDNSHQLWTAYTDGGVTGSGSHNWEECTWHFD